MFGRPLVTLAHSGGVLQARVRLEPVSHATDVGHGDPAALALGKLHPSEAGFRG